MRFVGSRRSVSQLAGVGLVLAGLFVSPRPAAAQYTVQLLQIPNGMPATTGTFVYKINSSGQVLGTVRPTAADIEPTLWTGGVPQVLSLPPGYLWNDSEAYPQLNDSGTVVARVLASTPPVGLPYASAVAVWKGGSANPMPSLMPSTVPVSAGGCGGYNDFYPVGINNSGHVLFYAADIAANPLCEALYLWDGPDTSTFHQVPLPEVPQPTTGPCPFGFAPSALYSRPESHLNDADHISVNTGARSAGVCSYSGVVLAGPGYDTPLNAPVPLSGGLGGLDGAHALNNHDQVLISTSAGGTANDLALWAGTRLVVDLGPVGNGFLNDPGQVLFNVPNGFSAFGALVKARLFSNGGVADVPLPSALPGCFYYPTIGTSFSSAQAIGPHGELAVGMVANCNGYSGPDVSQYANVTALLIPAPPTVSLKVNGQHPGPPPIVATTGPMTLTLDMSASAYTGTLSWYWGLVVNSQLVWVTSTGLSATPAPLVVAPPVAIASATLLNVTLPPATTLASFFFLVDTGGAVVALDAIEATRP
jgi:hypothetical protein